MFIKKAWFVPGAFVALSFFGISAANGENPSCYNLASLQGSYAVIGTYGANVAIAYGVVILDGNGNLTSTFIVNEPTAGSATGDRTIVTGTQTGTYTVNCDGTGVVTRILTVAGGTPTTGVDDFIITGAIVKDGQFIATAFADAQRTPSTIVPGGIFLTRTFTRLPDRPGPTQP